MLLLAAACSGKAVVDGGGGAGGDTGSGTTTGSGATTSTGTTTTVPDCSEMICIPLTEGCSCSATCAGQDLKVECSGGVPNYTCTCYIDGSDTGMGVLTKDPDPCNVLTGACEDQFFAP